MQRGVVEAAGQRVGPRGARERSRARARSGRRPRRARRTPRARPCGAASRRDGAPVGDGEDAAQLAAPVDRDGDARPRRRPTASRPAGGRRARSPRSSSAGRPRAPCRRGPAPAARVIPRCSGGRPCAASTVSSSSAVTRYTTAESAPIRPAASSQMRARSVERSSEDSLSAFAARARAAFWSAARRCSSPVAWWANAAAAAAANACGQLERRRVGQRRPRRRTTASARGRAAARGDGPAHRRAPGGGVARGRHGHRGSAVMGRGAGAAARPRRRARPRGRPRPAAPRGRALARRARGCRWREPGWRDLGQGIGWGTRVGNGCGPLLPSARGAEPLHWPSDPGPAARALGEVAEWLKALAC